MASRAARARLFKKGISAEDAREQRRKQHQVDVQLRRRQYRNKRRRLVAMKASAGSAALATRSTSSGSVGSAGSGSMGGSFWDDSSLAASSPGLLLARGKEAMRGYLGAGADSKQRVVSLRALSGLLSQVGSDPDDLIDAMIKAGVVKELVASLRSSACDEQLQAAWCLTNIASGSHEQTRAVLPAAPVLAQLLSGTNKPLIERAAWALGNVAGDCEAFRDRVVALGVLPPLHRLLAGSLTAAGTSSELVRVASWTLSNLLKGRALPAEFFKTPFMPLFGRLLAEGKDAAVITEVCWCLAYCTAKDGNLTGRVIASGFAPRLTAVLSRGAPSAVATPALRALGNLLAFNDRFNSAVMDACGSTLLQRLALLVRDKHRGVAKEAICVVANVLAGPAQHARAVADAGFLPVLLQILKNAPFDLQREAAYALHNAARDPRYLPGLVKGGVISPLLSMVQKDDVDTIEVCLRFVELILRKHDQGPDLVEEADGIAALESLQTHSNERLYDHARAIVDEFWGLEDEVVSAPKEEQVQYPPWRLGARAQSDGKARGEQIDFAPNLADEPQAFDFS